MGPLAMGLELLGRGSELSAPGLKMVHNGVKMGL